MVRAKLVLAMLVVGLAASTVAVRNAQAERRRGVIIEIAEHDGPEFPPPAVGTWRVELVVRDDGTFERVGQQGRLDSRQRTELRRLAARARMTVTNTIGACASPIRSAQRVRNWRGELVWAAPCASSPDSSVQTLIARARALTEPPPPQPPRRVMDPPDEPPPPEQDPNREQPVPQSHVVLFRFERNSFEQVEVPSGQVIYNDGRWQSGMRSGQLAPQDLAALQREIAITRVANAPRDARFECAARMTGTASVEVLGRGSLRWNEPCGQLDPSLGRLIDHVRALTHGP